MKHLIFFLIFSLQINYLIAQNYEYTIEHFGGVGDNSTDNRNAFDACLSQGYPVILQPNKIYRVSHLNDKSYSHITIRGGANSVISGELDTSLTYTALFTSLKNVTVSNVTFRNYITVFRGNKSTDFANNLNFINTKFISNKYGLWFDSSQYASNINFYNCSFDSLEKGVFIQIDSVNNIKISNSSFTNIQKSGIEVAQDNLPAHVYRNLTINNCYFENMYPYSISNNKEVHAILVFGENITLTGNFIKNVLDNSTATPSSDDSEAMYVKGTNITIEGNTIIDGGVGDAAIVSKGEYALNYEGMQKNESAFNNLIIGNSIIMTKKYYDSNSTRQNFCAIYSHDYSVKISNNQINGYFISAIKTGVGGSSIDNNFISISNGVNSCEAIVAMAEADTCRGMQINNNTILLPVNLSNTFTGLRINTFHQDGTTIRYVKNLNITGNIIQGFFNPIKIQGYKTNAGTISLTDIHVEDNILSNTSTFNSNYGISFTSDNQAGGGPYGSVNAAFDGLYIKGNTINNSQNAVSFLGGTNYNNVFIDGNNLNSATTFFNGLTNVTTFTGQSYFNDLSIKYVNNTLTGTRELLYPTFTKNVTFGNGSTTTFSFAHGLSSIPVFFSFQPTSSVSNFYITADATNVTLNFTSAPPSGSTGFIIVRK